MKAPLLYTKASSKEDLLGILELQQKYLLSNLDVTTISSQGFLTVKHSLKDLTKLNAIEQHIICTNENKVIAYILAMTSFSKSSIPILRPMFAVFNKIIYRNKPISAYTYLVVGQVCVAESYRGKGVFESCYAFYKSSYKDSYDFAITEIATNNFRSIQAHKKIGFKEVFTYKSPDLLEWSVVIWQW
ncbi:MAG: GNAT family N-acetyltransferase [Flavobacteriaceae bacterium CG_4_8_14_3_um_filter_34_10]|nr:GNAT family N-acetyltransferase [Flavobacteriia bacterium]OIP50523.1 MAG: GNAT family N-acetyltransferase [Flavobacteriaceae bacterium CG2_30_34_30]PIQ19190.1 MAG: GNAT family N-acetyltransferase [Flavobacteriaceae bacterium CG18_big_fil_WC_8_21_14_2_50_34_36]PIV50842.1 MAG: GNAT family N-acetyltransferase [Flavobacteriaceae bacterium CG02_land_8_20_14_3_00_34_13]PIX09604.1 MAG: GNAT family N-acetyltransferase [Flavobacteriaceae bacterium CG_4_8_14_3_um_filter_34_10]PIZ08964.1 MAG: GNAT fam